MDFCNRKLILAPMAGITEPIFREICRKSGADIVVSEMISSEGLWHKAKHTMAMVRCNDKARPEGIQLFGANPEKLAFSARYVEENAQPDYIDLNCGCPAPKIWGKNGGSALLKDIKLFNAIVSAMVKAVSTPVTVKLRSGWKEHEWVDVEFAKAAQDCGAAAVALHPRSKTMGFGGRAYRDRIALVKQSVSIPVIGNGDVTDGPDAKSMFDETGCDAVMIGRGAMGNPWIFDQARQCINGLTPQIPAPAERLDSAKFHLSEYLKAYGEHRAAREMKKHIAWYIKGLPQASVTRTRIFSSKSTAELESIIEEFKGTILSV
jgi:nifR3 family TIM-barrel protein